MGVRLSTDQNTLGIALYQASKAGEGTADFGAGSGMVLW
jgi:hypothetical protein